MRKLNVDALQVDSFETTVASYSARGTVKGHAEVGTTVIGPGTGVSDCAVCQPMSVNFGCIDTYDVRNCGETRYFDCTYGCTVRCSDPRLSCGPVCYVNNDDTLVCVKE
jgi:hypothetical protein